MKNTHAFVLEDWLREITEGKRAERHIMDYYRQRIKNQNT